MNCFCLKVRKEASAKCRICGGDFHTCCFVKHMSDNQGYHDFVCPNCRVFIFFPNLFLQETISKEPLIVNPTTSNELEFSIPWDDLKQIEDDQLLVDRVIASCG